MLKVNLLRYTPEGEELIASAAKLCYSAVGVGEIEKSLDKESTGRFLDMLVGLGHDSPIEHVNFTFAVEGVSRSLTHQLVRHRIASFSQQSQRYVKLSKFEYIIPPSIRENWAAKEIFIKAMERDSKDYSELVEILYESRLEIYKGRGVTSERAERMAEKEAIEDARYVFPNACETKIVFTMNARTLMNFFNLRACNRAQWEIRKLAEEMLRLVREIYPNLFANAGPECIRRNCPEGNMSCGKVEEVRRKYGEMNG